MNAVALLHHFGAVSSVWTYLLALLTCFD